MRCILTSLVLFTFSLCKAQILKHTDLSRNFNFETSIKRIKTKNAFDSCLVKISIFNKQNDSLIQSIKFKSDFLFEFSYSTKNTCRSYTTDKNRYAPSPDNDFGDLIIADFNFDGKEDLAFKTEEGGNGGPMYSFYIQTPTNTFKKDHFLTDKMMFFPSQIKPSNRTLLTIVHANAMGVNHNTYQLDSLTSTWKLIKTRFVGAN